MPVNCKILERNYKAHSGIKGDSMYPRLFIAIAMTSLLLTAQQDVPLRGPGQFSATAAGAVIGTLQGDASATRFSDGRREFYLLLNSDVEVTEG